jgi:hypothetical protein
MRCLVFSQHCIYNTVVAVRVRLLVEALADEITEHTSRHILSQHTQPLGSSPSCELN